MRSSRVQARQGHRSLRTLVMLALTGAALVVPFTTSAARPAAGNELLAVDDFDRHVTGGWRLADRGGRYLHSGGEAAFTVADGVGRVVLGVPGEGRSAELSAVVARDVDFRFRVAIDRLADGTGVTVATVLRHEGADQYRARLTVHADGSAWLTMVAIRNGVSKQFGGSERVGGIRVSSGGSLWVRAQAVGVAPTTLRAKVWAAGTAEPAAWRIIRRDTGSDLRAAGRVGVRVRLSPTATTAPIGFAFDDVQVARVSAAVAPPPETSGFPPNKSLGYVQTPAMPLPGYLTPVTDRTWGTTVTRIGNVAGVRNGYSRRAGWNADQTYLYLGFTNPGRLLDGRTYADIKSLNIEDGAWANTDPNVMYTTNDWDYANGRMRTNVLVAVDVRNERRTTLHTFAGYTNVTMGDYEGSQSDDDRYFALMGEIGGRQQVMVYDRVADKVVSTRTFATRPNNVTMSRTGAYVVVQHATEGSSDDQGTQVYDRDMTRLRQISTYNRHSDTALDADGNDVWVGNDGAVTSIALSSGAKTALLPSGNAFEYGHYSGRNTGRIGWAYMSNYDTTVTGGQAGRDQIVAVKLDGSQTVEVFAFAHHGGNVYAAMPFAVPSRDGKRVLFGSEWDASNVYAFVAGTP